MAGFGFARHALVKQMAGAYGMLALCSLMLAGLWHAMSVPAGRPQDFALAFYQHVLGHLDGRSCPSYPVCSVYARESIAKHGPVLGSWLAIDRLIHEAGDVHGKSIIVVRGEKRFYDPLARNDFWLTRMDFSTP